MRDVFFVAEGSALFISDLTKNSGEYGFFILADFERGKRVLEAARDRLKAGSISSVERIYTIRDLYDSRSLCYDDSVVVHR